MPSTPEPAKTRDPAPDRRLRRRQRLTRPRQFAETYAQQKRTVGRYMVLWRRDGGDSAQRLGVVASRRIGSAVKRNRARRRLRAAFRLNRAAFSGTADIVLVARPAVLTARWEDLVAELVKLAGCAGLSGTPP